MNPTQMLLLAALLFFLVLLGYKLWNYLIPRLKNARDYARLMQTCGYLPDAPTDRGHRWLMHLARCITFVQVGQIRVIGQENLEFAGDSFLLTPNHPHYADLAVVPLVLNRKARYMAARGVMTAFGGVGGLLTGPMGGFACDLTPGKGGPAKDAAVEILAAGKHPLVIFPEGWAHLDGHMGKFKKGAVRIAREAATKTGRPSFLVPVFLKYGKYPGKWITRLDPRLEYLLIFMLACFYRRGVTVVVGKPLSSDQLPQDDSEATEMLKQRICSLAAGLA